MYIYSGTKQGHSLQISFKMQEPDVARGCATSTAPSKPHGFTRAFLSQLIISSSEKHQ